jgi:ribosomal-protein-alanine N-acetyltransferase
MPITIETERLRMIPLSLASMEATLNDRPALNALCGARVPDDWPGPDLLEVLASIAANQEMSAQWAAWNGIIIHKADNAAIGSMGLGAGPDRAGSAEVGYAIVAAYRNHGYATEMLRGLVAYALQEQNIKQIVAECLEDNAGSIRVLEKAGFRRVGKDGNLIRWEISH